MINKELMVEIPERFEKQIRAKFDLRRMDKDGIIKIDCPLCAVYKRIACIGCPFNKFSRGVNYDCYTWTRGISKKNGFRAHFTFTKITNIKQFKKFKKEAAKYITFVEEA